MKKFNNPITSLQKNKKSSSYIELHLIKLVKKVKCMMISQSSVSLHVKYLIDQKNHGLIRAFEVEILITLNCFKFRFPFSLQFMKKK